MCLDVGFPSQTQARLRCDHAECVTQILRSEWHLSPELKPLGSVSINTKIVSHTLIGIHIYCSLKCERWQNPELFGVASGVCHRQSRLS